MKNTNNFSGLELKTNKSTIKHGYYLNLIKNESDKVFGEYKNG